MARFRFCIFFLACLIIMSITMPCYSKNIALMVGINDYTYLGSDGDLQGCVNDVKYMKQLLMNKYGFQEQDIKVLFDKEATADRIVKEFKEWIIKRAEPGDLVIFHYSGHGTRITDDNGDEPDGLDEALCAADCRSDKDTGYIRDDLLGKLIDGIKTQNVTIILDCCHSGTATRDLYGCSPRNRYYIPEFMVGRGVPGNDNSNNSKDTDMLEKGVVITGCESTQTSADAYWQMGKKGIWMGALTNNLYRALVFSTPGATFKEVMNNVKQDIAAQGYEQRPRLESKKDDDSKPFFYVNNKNVSNAIPVNMKGNDVILNMGAMGDAVTPGSLYQVYPSSEKSFTGNGIALIQITQVGDFESKGKIVEGEINQSGKAVEVARKYEQGDCLNIIIPDASLKSKLSSELSKISYVKLIDAGLADRIIDVYEGRVTLYYPDGREISHSSSSSSSVIIDEFSSFLKNAYTIKKLSGLENPKPAFKLDLWVDKKDNPTYRIGETITFNFKVAKDAYVYLIDVGTDGTITLLYPNKFNDHNKVMANTVYKIPSDEMNFKIKVSPPPGQEMVKAIASEVSIDLTSLTGIDPTVTFKSITNPVSLNDIPDLLSKGLSIESVSSQDATPLNGWAAESVVLNIQP